MAVPRQHPIHERIRLAEETVKIMWRSYDAYLAASCVRDDAWEAKAWEVFQRCMRCQQSLEKLKAMRDSALGPDKVMSIHPGRWIE